MVRCRGATCFANFRTASFIEELLIRFRRPFSRRYEKNPNEKGPNEKSPNERSPMNPKHQIIGSELVLIAHTQGIEIIALNGVVWLGEVELV